jgi:carbamoyltransferase
MYRKRYESGYIVGLSRGHNASVCLLKDGKIVFNIEEERLSRQKYDGMPMAGIYKILDYTDKVDHVYISHTTPLDSDDKMTIDYTGDDVYSGIFRKLGLIDRKPESLYNHPQVTDMAWQHHKTHAACAFYRSGFDDAVAVIIDGAGSVSGATWSNDVFSRPEEHILWEVESIIDCEYPAEFNTKFKHVATRDPACAHIMHDQDAEKKFGELGNKYINMISNRAGIVKVYEAVTQYCGFQAIEAGKTMGLFPYGKPNDDIPALFEPGSHYGLGNNNVVIPTYPNGASINHRIYPALQYEHRNVDEDVTLRQDRRDLAYACQTQTQFMALNYILSAVEMTGRKNVVLSGGYALNCVANYHYLQEALLKEKGINLYVEPISSDAGNAIGVALWGYHETTRDEMRRGRDIYLGPDYNYKQKDVDDLVAKYECQMSDASQSDVVKLITEKNIVAMFQGRSESGPRALGNRSILYDPRDPDGKDHVNKVKRREYFRPFAGTILAEDVHEWFDLRGMEDSPHMMYAVNCQEGVAEKIPCIIHVDNTCRIQTVTKEENENYYNLISEFKKQTGVPIVFNTSFNLGGEPLVETLDDAFNTLQQSDIEYLYLPEFGKLLYFGNFIE